MNEKGASFIQNELKEDLIKNLASKIDGMMIESDNNDPMILYVKYPAAFSDQYISSMVKLEIGPVAAKTPTEVRVVEPYCFKYFNVDDKHPFNVEIVSIERTFWEKLLILYAECNRPIEKKTPSRYSRYFYDVYMIYKSDYFERIIKNLRLFEEVKCFKSKYYRTSWSNIENCALNNMKIVPLSYRLDEISADYDKMKDMIFDNRPTFEEIVNGLKELNNELNCCNQE